ncbi:MAG: polyribonucleotide nucleotidyltransferase [Proteobacteria bacterium]|nr:polyribonucleotide nucleotidyltransferase [Cystobacterineae bacterium]MCL2314521.1 polyribonucleotide nucleotidyltransferase [Pseudomonadota bacterium]
MYLKDVIELGGQSLSIETGRMAKQADGAVVLRYGDTMLLATAVASHEKRDVDFLPLTVEYKENLCAAGRIPGSFFRREGKLTEKETLTSRLVDRSCRPLFAEGFSCEIQLIINVISADNMNDPDILSITATSAALMVSDLPFHGPIAGVRIGRIDGEWLINPTYEQREKSDIDLVVACSKEAIVMVEGGAGEVSEAEMLAALECAQKACAPMLAMQEQMRAQLGKKARIFEAPEKISPEFQEACHQLAQAGIVAAYEIADKKERYAALSATKAQLLAELRVKQGEQPLVGMEKKVGFVFEELKYKYMREMILSGGRIAKRAHDEVRPISIEVGVLPRAHGSALFTRGETQALAVATLGTTEDEQRIEHLQGQSFRRFMLHYNFPPFSVNEVKQLRGPGRREIGHGALAERALRGLVPDAAKFPYTLRIVSDILESNGSSSMATVCGGTLAMMDAGVPIKAPVAGIAMGLVKEGERVAILSDILGDEDHLGDMDFKVCGTAKGITSVQMDIKITSITTELMMRAMEQARRGRLHILEKMAQALPEPRAEISVHAPRITTLQIRSEFIKNVIGPGGKTIKDIVARTGCIINIEDSGRVNIASANTEATKQAVSMIQALTREAEVGEVYLGIVRKVLEIGAIVELFPGTDGLVHISELSDKRVRAVTDIVKEGDEVMVKVTAVEKNGRIRLSRKQALQQTMASSEGDAEA